MFPSRSMRGYIACGLIGGLMTAVTLASPVQAQSVAPNSPNKNEDGGPMGSSLPPGAHPPVTQPKHAEALPGGITAPAGLPQAIRWTEDWSKPAAKDAPFLEKIRHIPLGDNNDWYLSLGGEERVYVTSWNHASLGLNKNSNNTPIQSRARLIGDLHLGPNVRAYLEIGDNREWNESFATKPNQNVWDIYQAFVDVTVPLGKLGKVTVRPGRFEMPLGNGKLMGVREGLNMRFTYQGLRATYILPGQITVDFFTVKPINILNNDAFDDAPNHQQQYKGVYVSSARGIAGLGTDVYWYRVDRQSATLREGTGRDERDNWGLRFWKRKNGIDFDLEGNKQTGTFNGQTIDAWAVLFEGGYTFEKSPFKPRIGARFNAFSGDSNLKDDKAGTFVPASARLPLISEAAFFNLSNLVDFYPSVTVAPVKNVSIMVGPDFLWRESRADGVYIGSTGASFSPYYNTHRIGTDYNLEATYQMSKRLSFRVFETYFDPGSDFAAAGGKHGNYFGFLTDYRF